MLFNSYQYLLFIPLVCCAYFLIPVNKRNYFLLAASYAFYMAWEPSYLILILISTFVDYFAGIGISSVNSQKSKKCLVVLSLIANLSLLGVFKYFNFFSENIANLAEQFGFIYDPLRLDFLLPVGISFYTFQTLSYTIDVYRGITQPERRPHIFALYVAFFPQLVAGPIERSTTLLPQFDFIKKFNSQRTIEGMQLIIWGLFKKMVIADRLALYTDPVFDNYLSFQGPSFILASIAYTFQIYYDFSGYADIAIGSSRIMGFDLMDNFIKPFHAKTFRQLWQSWHITMATWFRDYLFMPLVNKRHSKSRVFIVALFVFAVSGLWHGPTWPFIAFGTVYGLFLLVEVGTSRARRSFYRAIGLGNHLNVLKYSGWMFRLLLVFASFVLFRSQTMDQAIHIYSHYFSGWNKDLLPQFFVGAFKEDQALIAFVGFLIVESVHSLQTTETRLYQTLAMAPRWLRWAFCLAITWFVFNLGVTVEKPFIYFQF